MVDAICSQCGVTFKTWNAQLRRVKNICCSVRCGAYFRHVPIEQRFWQYVRKTNSCWIWTGATADWGYGTISIRHGVMRGAHRVSWELHYGSMPHAVCVLHKCDNPPCVRPDHLFLGSLKDNTQDMLAKGRHIVKLTKDQMEEIRNRYALGNISQDKLGKEFGMSQSSIGRIIRRYYPSHR